MASRLMGGQRMLWAKPRKKSSTDLSPEVTSRQRVFRRTRSCWYFRFVPQDRAWNYWKQFNLWCLKCENLWIHLFHHGCCVFTALYIGVFSLVVFSSDVFSRLSFVRLCIRSLRFHRHSTYMYMQMLMKRVYVDVHIVHVDISFIYTCRGTCTCRLRGDGQRREQFDNQTWKFISTKYRGTHTK